MTWQSGLSIVGTAVGSYFGGPVGGAVGGAVGGYIGAHLDPAVHYQGPRLDDLGVQTSTYGANIPLVFGRGNRVAGNVIWSTGLIETCTSKKVKAGGKGGGGGTVTNTFTYAASFAVLVGVGPMQNIKTIWANKKVLWSFATMSRAYADLQTAAADAHALAAQMYAEWLLTPTNAGLYQGYLAQVQAANDLDDAVLAAEADIAIVTAGGNSWTLASGRGLLDSAVGSITFYKGDDSQTADPLIEGYLGAGNVPGYRGSAYVVINSLQLADYGNALPSLEFEVDGLPMYDTASIVGYVCDASGLQAGDYSIATGMAGDSVVGYSIATASSALSALTPLSTAYAFDAREQCGNVRFMKRSIGLQATIPLDAMGARTRDDGGKPDQPIQLTRAPDYTLLDRCTITYKSANFAYQNSTQVSERIAGASQNIRNETLPVVLTDDAARRIADRMLYESWVGRVTAEFSVSDSYRWVQAGALVVLPVADSLQPFRVTQTARGVNGVTRVEATLEDPYIYESDNTGSTPVFTDPTASFVGNTTMYAFNSPILEVGESATAFTWAANAPDPGWRGGQIYRSVDYGLNYTAVSTVSVRNTTGVVASALPTGAVDLWDRVNTIDVVLDYTDDELVSVTEDAVLAGRNAFWLGAADGSHGEIIQFANATLLGTSPPSYRLDTLLRGRRATEHEVSLHGANEVFVYFEDGLVHTADYGMPDYGVPVWYKGVSIYQNILDAVTIDRFTNTCERAMPRAPVHGAAERDASGNAVLTWVRRNRGYPPALGRGPVEMDEAVEAYEVDIYFAGTVRRTLTASTPTVGYTASQQTADGITPGTAFDCRVYQISATVGRGHPGIFHL